MKKSNECFLVNKEMERLSDVNYNVLLHHDEGIDECSDN